MSKWYFWKSSVFVALILLGPLAFPLLWKSPAYSRFWKIFLTVVFTLLTVYCVVATWAVVASVLAEMKRTGLL
ncbi:MAG: hypothetical protein WC352_03040 [Candidatus Omnitrophota bacterium]